MLEGFIEHSNDLAGDYAGSWSTISSLNAKNYEQKREYEEKIEGLEQEIKELEKSLEEETSDCHLVLEALEVARQWRVRQTIWKRLLGK